MFGRRIITWLSAKERKRYWELRNEAKAVVLTVEGGYNCALDWREQFKGLEVVEVTNEKCRLATWDAFRQGWNNAAGEYHDYRTAMKPLNEQRLALPLVEGSCYNFLPPVWWDFGKRELRPFSPEAAQSLVEALGIDVDFESGCFGIEFEGRNVNFICFSNFVLMILGSTFYYVRPSEGVEQIIANMRMN